MNRNGWLAISAAVAVTLSWLATRTSPPSVPVVAVSWSDDSSRSTQDVSTPARSPLEAEPIVLDPVLVGRSRAIVEDASASNPGLPSPCVTGQVKSFDVGPGHAWIGTVDVFDRRDRIERIGIERSGRFRLENLPARPLRLRVHCTGFEPAEQEFVPGTGIEPAAVEVVVRTLPRLSMHLEIEPGLSVRGLRDPSLVELASRLRPFLSVTEPVVGEALPPDLVRIPARREAPREPEETVWHDFALNEWQDGFCGVVLGTRVLDVQPFVAGQRHVTCRAPSSLLVASTGSVRMRLVDERGVPKSGVHVWVRSDDTATADLYSDECGVCRFERISPGPVELRVIPRGQPRVDLTRVLLPGGYLNVGDVTVDDGITLCGRLGDSPEAFARASIFYFRIVDGRADGHQTFRKLTTGNEFEAVGLSRGEYGVGCSTELRNPPTVADVRAGRAPGWTLVDLRQGPVPPLLLWLPREEDQGTKGQPWNVHTQDR